MKRDRRVVEARRRTILDEFERTDGEVRSSDLLAKLPGVSSALLLNELTRLLDAGKIVRVGHGVFKRSPSVPTSDSPPLLSDSLFRSRLAYQKAEKQGIAKHVVNRFLRADGFFAVDGGTTTAMIIQQLVADRPAASHRMVTNNLAAMSLVGADSKIDLILIGGRVAHSYGVTCGPCMNDLSGLDVAFIGFSRLTAEGAWIFDATQVDVTRQLIDAARQTVFVGTLDKLGVPFSGPSLFDFHAAKKKPFSVVASANATSIDPHQLAEIERLRAALGDRLVLVDSSGEPMRKKLS